MSDAHSIDFSMRGIWLLLLVSELVLGSAQPGLNGVLAVSNAMIASEQKFLREIQNACADQERAASAICTEMLPELESAITDIMTALQPVPRELLHQYIYRIRVSFSDQNERLRWFVVQLEEDAIFASLGLVHPWTTEMSTLLSAITVCPHTENMYRPVVPPQSAGESLNNLGTAIIVVFLMLLIPIGGTIMIVNKFSH